MEASDFATLENTMKRHVIDALTLTRGNQRQAAALLGITRWKLRRFIVRFALQDLVSTIRSSTSGEVGCTP